MITFACVLASCRDAAPSSEKKAEESAPFFSAPPQNVPALGSNGLASEPTDFLAGQATSAIHWQPWAREVLSHAELSQRLILVFVGSTSNSNCHFIAKLLEDEFADEINRKYVPVMADLELDPSLAIACKILASERREAIGFPYLLWLSHEGNPVAWLSVQTTDEEGLLAGFSRAQKTVDTILESSPRYVVENSRYDNTGRVSRITQSLELPEDELPELTFRDLLRGGKQLIDLYDDIDSTFDGTGGIPPGNLITALSRIAVHPQTPQRFRKEANEVSAGALDLLVHSAIRDPLDGTFFLRRATRSFAVPAFAKHINTQSEMLSTIASQPRTLETTLAEQQLLKALNRDKAIASSLVKPTSEGNPYLWSLEAIASALTKEEMKVATLAFGLRTLGNIPASDDPSRQYFRRNSLGLLLQDQKLADAAELPLAESNELLASVLEKLKILRTDIFATSGGLLTETAPILADRARLLTAYSRSYATQPSATTLGMAENLASELLTHYNAADGSLLRCASSPGKRAIPAFASDYALLIEALLEFHRITWDAMLLERAQELATTLLNEHLDENDFLVEQKPEDQILTFPVHSPSMIFGPSTWAPASGFLKRFSSIGYQHPKLEAALAKMNPLLKQSFLRQPVVHTDFLHSAAINLEGYVLLVDGDLPAESAVALRRGLAQPKFDSVFALTEGANSKVLGKLGGKAAILYQNGEAVLTFEAVPDLLSTLQAHLSQN